MLSKLRGMFAFIIWDAKRKSLFMARDPYGIKPLYYADDGWTLRVASQVKALLAGGKVSRDPEPAGVVGFHLLGSVPEPFTMYQEIRQLPAGHYVWVDELGAGQPQQYFSIAGVYADAEKSVVEQPHEDAQQHIREALLESVRYHLVSDVPVGAFLSAGVDSGSLIGLMRDAGQNEISTVTLAFEEFRGQHEDESPLAEQVAKQYQTQHTTRWVTQQEFEQDIPSILDAMDQPSIDGINTWFVSKAAKELGLKVAISGLGGDELFGGYPSFRDIPRWVKWLKFPGHIPLLGKSFRTLANPVVKRVGISPKAAGMLEYGGTIEGAWLLRRGVFMPWELQEFLNPDLVREGLRRLRLMAAIRSVCRPSPNSKFAKVAALESSLYLRNQLLRDSDWAGMAHSLEIRVPLVDSKLLKQATSWHGCSKFHSKQALASAPQDPMPDTIVNRAKTGFGTPIATWMSQRRVGVTSSQKIQQGGHWSRSWSQYVCEAIL